MILIIYENNLFLANGPARSGIKRVLDGRVDTRSFFSIVRAVSVQENFKLFFWMLLFIILWIKNF